VIRRALGDLAAEQPIGEGGVGENDGSSTNVPMNMKVWLDGAAAAWRIVRSGGTM
jgi:hypothetical protein